MSKIIKDLSGEETYITVERNEVKIRFFNDCDNLCCNQLSQRFNRKELEDLITKLQDKLQRLT